MQSYTPKHPPTTRKYLISRPKYPLNMLRAPTGYPLKVQSARDQPAPPYLISPEQESEAALAALQLLDHVVVFLARDDRREEQRIEPRLLLQHRA